MFVELLSMYRWNLSAAVLSGAALAWSGMEVSARREGLHALLISQAALVGALVGMWLVHAIGLPDEFPYLSTIAFALIGGKLARDMTAKTGFKDLYVICFYALLLAVVHLLVSLAPGLETHMSQTFFGDPVTLANRDALILCLLAAACLGLGWKYRLAVVGRAFSHSVLGNASRSSSRSTRTHLLAQGLSFVLLCAAIQNLGFLFSIALLLIPTALLRLAPRQGLQVHQISVLLVGAIGSGAGFLLSLRFAELPTVPLILAMVFCLSGGAALAIRKKLGHD